MATMHLPKFEHLCPTSIEEAAQLLGMHGANARLSAGGTDLFPRMKQGLTRPEVVISLKGLAIDPPRVSRKGDLYINALIPRYLRKRQCWQRRSLPWDPIRFGTWRRWGAISVWKIVAPTTINPIHFNLLNPASSVPGTAAI